jgi:hypothetical protein
MPVGEPTHEGRPAKHDEDDKRDAERRCNGHWHDSTLHLERYLILLGCFFELYPQRSRQNSGCALATLKLSDRLKFCEIPLGQVGDVLGFIEVINAAAGIDKINVLGVDIIGNFPPGEGPGLETVDEHK